MEEKRLSPAERRAGICIAGLLLVCVVGVVLNGIFPEILTALGSFLKAPATAAWVQAVGSVAAIGVAIYVPWDQARKTVARQRREALGPARIFAWKAHPQLQTMNQLLRRHIGRFNRIVVADDDREDDPDAPVMVMFDHDESEVWVPNMFKDRWEDMTYLPEEISRPLARAFHEIEKYGDGFGEDDRDQDRETVWLHFKTRHIAELAVERLRRARADIEESVAKMELLIAG